MSLLEEIREEIEAILRRGEEASPAERCQLVREINRAAATVDGEGRARAAALLRMLAEAIGGEGPDAA